MHPPCYAPLYLFAIGLCATIPAAAQAPPAPDQTPTSSPTLAPPPTPPPAVYPARPPRVLTPYPPDTQPDTPWAIWAPASPANFQYWDPTAPPRTIDTVVIHDIEGSARSTVAWFKNPQARATAHYVLDGGTGTVYQMVKERDIAWHAGNGDINGRSIGIEHQGYAYRPGYYDPTEYETSARLVREITARYHIPRDRQHIFGHSEVPDPAHPGEFGGRSHHQDPGPYWDWDYYMTLVRNDAKLDAPAAPTPVLHPGEKTTVVVNATNLGDDPWPAQPGAGNMDQRGIALASRNPVYLGVWPIPASLPQTSPLHDVRWTSPRLVGLPDGAVDIAPGGGAGTFSVVLQAPPVDAAGSITTQFRLIQTPPAPHMPVGFGPVLPITVRVEPWDVIAAAAGAPAGAFTAGQGWSVGGSGAYWTRYTVAAAATTASAAQWTVSLPLGGAWSVYARWTTDASRTRKATYSIDAADGTHAVTVDQRQRSGVSADSGWHLLGRFSFASLPNAKGSAAPAVVRLTADAPGIAVADAVRFVGPFPVAGAVPDTAPPLTPPRQR